MFDIAELPNKYRGFFIGYGPRTFDTEPGTILTSFVDNSPSMDNFSTMTEVLESYSKSAVQFGFKFGHYNGLSHSILVDLTFGDLNGGQLNYSLGYSKSKIVGNGILVIRPHIYGGFGNYGFDVGEIENNAGYIQINNTQYFDEYLNADLKSQVGVWGPGLDVYWMVHDHASVYLNVGLDITSDNSNPELRFTAPSGSDSPESSLPIDTDNPNVTFQGDKLTKLPYKTGGLRIGIGAAFTWQKY